MNEMTLVALAIGTIYVAWQLLQIGIWIWIGRNLRLTIRQLEEFKQEGKKDKWLH